MSKKSRKRNKKILAAIGIGLGAAALASRKPKQSSTEENSGRGGDGPAAIARQNVNKTTTAKKDTSKKSDSMPSNLSKDTGKDNKPTTPEDVKMTSANVQAGLIDAPYKGFFKSGIAKRQAENAEFNANIRKKRNPAVTGTTLPGMKSGGRVKGCGKALRGYGKAMKGKK